MFPGPRALIDAILLALGIWWCLEMFPRWRDDFNKLRQANDWSDRVVVIVLWSITGVIAFLCARFVIAIGRDIVGGIRDLL